MGGRLLMSEVPTYGGYEANALYKLGLSQVDGTGTAGGGGGGERRSASDTVSCACTAASHRLGRARI